MTATPIPERKAGAFDQVKPFAPWVNGLLLAVIASMLIYILQRVDTVTQNVASLTKEVSEIAIHIRNERDNITRHDGSIDSLYKQMQDHLTDPTIHHADVDRRIIGFCRQQECLRRIAFENANASGKIIGRSIGNDCERSFVTRPLFQQAARNFVDRAVASCSDHDLNTVRSCLFCVACCIARLPCDAHIDAVPVIAQLSDRWSQQWVGRGLAIDDHPEPTVRGGVDRSLSLRKSVNPLHYSVLGR